MDISEYRNRNRKRIELPSGLAGFVRLPSVMDMAAYPGLVGGAENGTGDKGEGEFNPDFLHCVLRRCFIPERGKMTDKEPGDCLPGELSIYEIDKEDTGAIVAAVGEMGAENAPPGGEAGGGAAFPETSD